MAGNKKGLPQRRITLRLCLNYTRAISWSGVPLENHLSRIICMPMFNSYGLVDVILTGDGMRSRQFLNASQLVLALQRAGISKERHLEDLALLEHGFSCEIRAEEIQVARSGVPDLLCRWMS